MRIIDYFKQESKPVNKLFYGFNFAHVVVSQWRLLTMLALVAGFSCLTITACSQISLQRKAGHSLIKNNSSNENKGDSTSGQLSKPVNLSGLWKVGFRYQGKTGLSSMQIRQNNQSFVGFGKDEQNGATFKIDNGSIKGNEIIFLKRYDNCLNQPVQYHGQFSYLSTENGETPYMGGDFSLEINGAVTIGDWEAAMAGIKTPAVAVNENKKSTNEEQPAAHIDNIEHSPDLSGKWNVAYEYNFKIAHSIMFLEQDGNKLSGHGFDLNNKEKFIIKKGWYSFPHITIVRQYITGSQPARTITFKADVTYVSDKDYTGPYLNGKTQGGGEWEAERVN